MFTEILGTSYASVNHSTTRLKLMFTHCSLFIRLDRLSFLDNRKSKLFIVSAAAFLFTVSTLSVVPDQRNKINGFLLFRHPTAIVLYEELFFSLAIKEAHLSFLLSIILQLFNSGLKIQHLSLKEKCEKIQFRKFLLFHHEFRKDVS